MFTEKKNKRNRHRKTKFKSNLYWKILKEREETDGNE